MVGHQRLRQTPLKQPSSAFQRSLRDKIGGDTGHMRRIDVALVLRTRKNYADERNNSIELCSMML